MEGVIQLNGVTKRFEDTVALDQISMSIEKGKVYGLIGRNGAGKTTLLKLLAGQLLPSEGTLAFENDIHLTEGNIALGRDYNIYFANYKVKNILEIARKVNRNWDHELEAELMEDFELDAKKRYIQISKGMQTMISLIIALCSRPKVLLLDEPYAGLDPINRETFYKILRREYFDSETTVILSSHLITEIEGYFENAIIINKGKILVNDQVESIYEKSYTIEISSQYKDEWVKNKNVINEETLLGQSVLSIYDTLTDGEKDKIIQSGGKISKMDLQKLMIGLCQRKGGKK